VIAVEDLNIEGMLKNHHLAKAISSVSWGTFVDMLQYKVDWYGRELIKDDRFFASTQNCSECGYRNPLLKDLSIREWTCPVCGTHHDRDENSSDNEYKIALTRLKQSVGQELPELTPVERDNMDDCMATYLKSEPSLKQEASTSTSGR
jgi:putative transposase